MNSRILNCAVILLCGVIAFANSTEVEIQDLGSVLGVDLPSGITQFLGIPYGVAPTGSRRWKLPEPITPWHDMPFLANFSSACVQVKSRWGRTDLVYTEDCLRLNIWAQTKNLETADKLRPVLVFIHGGSHAYGAGLEHYFSPDAYVLEEDVIMVSINYRLGALGLLYHPTFDAANLPIFDQRLALQWIKAHIKDFGGDPDSIAVMGESAGAHSISMHMSAKDLDSHTLFKRAIMMSIPAAYPALSVTTAHNLAEKRTAEWGCSNADKHLEAACLRALPAEIFTDPPIAKRSLFWHSVHDSPLLLVKDTGVFDPLIDTFLAGKVNLKGIDMIIGTTSQEGTLFSWLPFLLYQPSEAVYHDIAQRSFSAYEIAGLPDRVLAKYEASKFADAAPLELSPALKAIAEIHTDTAFQCPARELIKKIVKQGAESGDTSKVYTYVWSHAPANTSAAQLGAFHGVELAFFFKTTPGLFWPTKFTEAELDLSTKVVHALATFVKTGNPSTTHLPWKPVTNEKRMWVNFKSDQIIQEEYKEPICDFWLKEFPRGYVHHVPIDILEGDAIMSQFLNVYVIRAAMWSDKNRGKLYTGLGLVLVTVFYVSWSWFSSKIEAAKLTAAAIQRNASSPAKGTSAPKKKQNKSKKD